MPSLFSSSALPGYRLEQYSLRYPKEVLRVALLIDQTADEVLVFRGFSSSLMRATAADPDVPVIPPEAHIATIDRLQAPYRADAPIYLAQGLTWAKFDELLQQHGL